MKVITVGQLFVTKSDYFWANLAFQSCHIVSLKSSNSAIQLWIESDKLISELNAAI